MYCSLATLTDCSPLELAVPVMLLMVGVAILLAAISAARR